MADTPKQYGPVEDAPRPLPAARSYPPIGVSRRRKVAAAAPSQAPHTSAYEARQKLVVRGSVFCSFGWFHRSTPSATRLSS
jgi:hypothetical protein